jgi:hypothetical protein
MGLLDVNRSVAVSGLNSSPSMSREIQAIEVLSLLEWKDFKMRCLDAKTFWTGSKCTGKKGKTQVK